MKIAVLCEFSGIVRNSFAKLGHDAWSCDLLSSDTPGNHIQGDLRDYYWDDFDIVIAHPPCTYLCSSGARWWENRKKEQKEAVELCLHIMGIKSRVCMENPIGKLSTTYRKPDQIIHPWQFGHGETKSTCLWLKDLPKLKPTRIVKGRENRIHKMSASKDRWKKRSLTYNGIANAMAKQWGSISR
jgi:hypothetical protein